MITPRKALLLSLLVFLLVLSASCQSAELAPVQGEPAITSPNVEADTPAPPGATETMPPAATEVSTDVEGGQVTANIEGIALTYPFTLAQKVTVETIPAFEIAADEWVTRYFAHPAITRLHISGYPIQHEYNQAHIDLLPVEAAISLQLRAEQRIEQLQEMLVAQPEPLLSAGELPFLPVPNAAQLVHAAEAYLSFESGNGLRYLTVYAQDYVPITNDGLQYTFQGLTADGRFYVSAVFPLRSNVLPEDIAAAQEEGWAGTTYHLDSVAYDSYLQEQRDLLNNQGPEQFTPSLTELDALVQSLDLSTYDGPAAQPWAAEVLPAPEQVVDHFLDRYVSGGGFASGAHQDDPALHPDYVASLDTLAAGWQEQGANLRHYDPILMSTNLGEPQGFNFESLYVWPGNITENEAEVRVDRRWLGMDTVLPLTYSLQWGEEAGAWQISGVSTILSHPARPISAAERVVESVFTPGLATLPGVSTPELDSLELPSEVETHLCIQDCPWGFAIEGAFAAGEPDETGGAPFDVVLYTSFYNDVRLIRVELREGDYVVTGKTPALTPVERARAFYTWYLAEAEQSAAAGETRWASRVPRIEQMNEFSVFVTQRFLSQAYRRMVTEDPYLPGGAMPLSFRVEEGPQENTAFVNLTYEDGEHTLLLTFVEEMGRPLIENIESVDG